jgi:hypothetical protein
MLQSLITSKTRLRLLIKFFINVSNSGYLRGLASEMNENTNAIRKELNNLSEAGYLIKEELDSKVFYKANKEHPFFEILQALVLKHTGIDALVDRIVDRIGDVSRVFLIGDYEKGLDSGIIEVVLEGVDLNQNYIDHLGEKVAKEINKKVVITTVSSFEGKGLLIFKK